MDDSEAFARLLTALRPWLGQLVIVGGWVAEVQHRGARQGEDLPQQRRGPLSSESRPARLFFKPAFCERYVAS